MSSKYVIRFKALRPESLLLSLSSVLYGLFLCRKNINILTAIVTVLCALSLHIAINVANDYFDYKNKVDDFRSTVNSNKYVTDIWYFRCYIFFITFSIALGLYLIIKTDYIILLVGGGCILITYLYSGGKKPLANMAFGEFLSFLFFGPVACLGTYYIQCLNINNIYLFNSISIGLLVSCVMLSNNIRDIETDKIAGKLTIAVRLGKKNSNIMRNIFIICAFSISLLLKQYFILVSLPIVYFLVKEKNEEKNMKYTTLLTFIYSILSCIF